MSVSLSDIKAPVTVELDIFEEKFRQSMNSKVPLLDRITRYIVRRKGKQMRPLFVILVAKMLNQVGEKTYHAAALVELLHTATLVHDDVVDNSYQRRGFFSINALWKNKVAVLVGDYLLSKGLLVSLDNNHFDLLKIMSEAVREMSEGELLQMEKSRLLDIDEETYLKIIRQKTATLISSACACGAASATQDIETIKALKEFGEKVGMAFQIKDDLFDYGEDEIGKPRGIDIRERKLTLPLIFTLRTADRNTKSRIINILKNENEKKESVKELINLVKNTGGLEYTVSLMNNYVRDAVSLLHHFPDSPARKSLENLIHFTVERDI